MGLLYWFFLRYDEAAPLLETIFYIREKLVTISHVTVLECVVELVACLAAIEADDNAYRWEMMSHFYFTNNLLPICNEAEFVPVHCHSM